MLHPSQLLSPFITDRVIREDKAVASVRASVRPSVSLFPFYIWNRLTF